MGETMINIAFERVFRLWVIVAFAIGTLRYCLSFRVKKNKFISDRNGNVALIFAIVLGPLLLSTALAIDYSRYSRNYANLLNAADAGLLAASVKMSENLDLDDDDLQALMVLEFDNFMSVNFHGNTDNATFTRNILFDRENSVVTVDVSLTQSSVYNDVFSEAMFFGNQVYGDKTLSRSQTLGTKLTMIVENYVLDIVMCIDATGSMQNTLNSVQANASTFDVQLRQELGIAANDPRFKIRVRPIYFRDWQDTYYHNLYPWYYRDGLIPANDFYDLDDSGETSGFQTFLNSEYAFAGFDYPEASGACMNEGMRSNWYDVDNQTDFPQDENLTVFPIIVVWTDNAIQNLLYTKTYMSPTQPANYSSFEAQWENPAIIPQDPKMLILFGPENYAGWNTVKQWDNYVHGGDIWDGNDDAISIIAQNIIKAIPDTLRLTQ